MQSNLLHAQIALLDFQAARYLMTGDVPKQAGNDHPVSMPTSAYKTEDGYVNVAASGDAIWKRFAKAVGKEEWIERPEFKEDTGRSKNRKLLGEEIEKVLATRTSAEWIELLNEAGVPSGAINSMDQVFADPQVKHIGAAATVKHPTMGDIRIVNQAVTLTRTPASMARATPELGEHTDEVLIELGYTAAQIDALRANKAV